MKILITGINGFVADLLHSAAALLGTDHRALSGDGMGYICDYFAGADEPLHD